MCKKATGNDSERGRQRLLYVDDGFRTVNDISRKGNMFSPFRIIVLAKAQCFPNREYAKV